MPVGFHSGFLFLRILPPVTLDLNDEVKPVIGTVAEARKGGTARKGACPKLPLATTSHLGERYNKILKLII